jgi:hypothetical protein
MPTNDIRIWDGSSWCSIAGADGDPGVSVKDATADESNVPNKPDGSLGDATADVTEIPDANGDLTLAFDFGIPVGLPGASAETNVGTVATNTIASDQNATVSINDSDAGPNATLDFTFNIPKGEDGTGVNILGQLQEPAGTPVLGPPTQDNTQNHDICTDGPGSAWLDKDGDLWVWVEQTGDCAGGTPPTYNNVGSIQGPAGDSAEVAVGNVTTSTLACGNDAVVEVNAATGSTPSNLTMDFDFSIPTSSIDTGTLTLAEACTADGLTGTLTNSGTGTCAVMDLELNIPTFKAISSPEGSPPVAPCPGHMWIVTGP